jgi:hypothetical protein
MIRLPAGRFLTIPLPPGPLAARFFAAVIRPPLLFFAIICFFLLIALRVFEKTTMMDAPSYIYQV